MNIADVTIKIDDAVHGHTTELEQVYFLLIQLCNSVPRIWKSDERKPFTLPIALELLKPIGTYSEQFYIAFDKTRI